MFKKLIIFCTAVLVTQMTLGAVFIKFDGVDGESNHVTHTGYSDVLAWSWGTNSNSKSTCVQDFQLVKLVDKSSPILLMNQVTGKFYPKVTLAVNSNFVDGAVDYILLEFKNVRMTSHSTASNGDNRPMENIAISFDEVTYTYIKFNDDHSIGDREVATIMSTGKC